MSAAAEPQGKAMYVATSDDRHWLLNAQRKLHAQSRENPSYVFEKLWGLVTDPRNLRVALARVGRNRGSRTPGIDGITVRRVHARGITRFVDELRKELRSGAYAPRPVRRVMIPKAGKPGQFRPLGIPTVKDRVVQAAVKNVMEPIFEADFYPVSYGFRPGKSVHGAIAHLKALMLPRRAAVTRGLADRLPYSWAIEGDIKGCFDNIDHHALMERVRRRIGDRKLSRLVLAFLKSGVLAEAQFLRTESGTPQGGILSPLLANIALAAIEERYERYAWPRGTARREGRGGRKCVPLTDPDLIAKRAGANRARDKQDGRAVFMPIRYADDFIILVSAPPDAAGNDGGQTTAEQEKATLAAALERELGLQLSAEKTLITPVTSSIRFLGHHLKVRRSAFRKRQHPTAVIPKERTTRLRRAIHAIFGAGTHRYSLENRLKAVNPVLRGWANFYRHAWGAKRVFTAVDHYPWLTIRSWLKRKHQKTPMRTLNQLYGWRKPRGRMVRWRDGTTVPFPLATVRVRPFRLGWQKTPDFASTSMESPVRNERRTPGSVRGARKPARGQPG
jgi:group II intron reverse transcriptase/maturase